MKSSRSTSDDVVTVHGKQTFDVRGEFIPLVSIDDVFQWHGIDYGHHGSRHADDADAGDQTAEVVILQAAGKTMGLRVDELLGSQDIVIKSLSDNFINIRGLSGASILGDGSVCLMLDVGTVIDMATRPSRTGQKPRKWQLDRSRREQPLDATQLAALRVVVSSGIRRRVASARQLDRQTVGGRDRFARTTSAGRGDRLLAAGDEPICFCSAEMNGLLTGEMILAFDDASGLALADMLLDQPQGTTTEWTEMATSAALETTNILCCAYLNSLSESLAGAGESSELLPSPPRFSREFAESLLEFALMGQAIASDQVILARTRFEIDGTPVNWTLLFVPDAESMSRLPELLVGSEAEAMRSSVTRG